MAFKAGPKPLALTTTESNALKWVLLCDRLGIDPLTSHPHDLDVKLVPW